MINEENNGSNLFEQNITKKYKIEDLVNKILNEVENDNGLIDELLSNFSISRTDGNTAIILSSADSIARLLKVKNENQATIMKLIDSYLRIAKPSSKNDSGDDFNDYIDEETRKKILKG